MYSKIFLNRFVRMKEIFVRKKFNFFVIGSKQLWIFNVIEIYVKFKCVY